MRIEIIEVDGWRIEVRGRTRRTPALANEYLLALKDAHPDMKAAAIAEGKTSEAIAQEAPRAWGLAGVAATFRFLASRIRTATNGKVMTEPFTGDQLVAMFDHYLDCEQLPDRSDLWSQVEDAILRMDKPPSDPKAEGNLQTP